MTDLVKGILIGIIAVKVFESDAVQNYIHKAIRKKGHEVAKKVADAILPVTDDSKESEEKVVKRDENGKPISGRYPWQQSQYLYLYDADGKPYRVNMEALKL